MLLAYQPPTTQGEIPSPNWKAIDLLLHFGNTIDVIMCRKLPETENYLLIDDRPLRINSSPAAGFGQ